MIDDENAEFMVAAGVATTVYGLVNGAGLPVTAAMRLASYLILREGFGDDFLREQLGLSKRTNERWRKELRDADMTEIPELDRDFIAAMVEHGLGKR